MNLFTANNFTIVRQLQDPSTSGNTYYVRAVIRNAYTDTILGTLNLTDKGAQRFKADYKVPPDPSGQGFYISIVTSVYSDAGYTTKSTEYGDEETTYLVQDRLLNRNGGNGGLARRDVRDILQEELTKFKDDITPKKAEIVKNETPVEQKDYSKDIAKVLTAINALPKPEKPEKVDIKPILDAIAGLSAQVQAIEIPKLDLSPVLDAIQSGGENHELNAEEMKGIFSDMQTKFEAEIAALKKLIENMGFVTTFVTHANLDNTKMPQKDQNTEGESEQVDISKLSQ